MAEFNLEKSDSGTNLKCQTGDIIHVSLPENPTTGYRWHITTCEGLILADDSFEIGSHTEETKIGSGGLRIFKFEYQAAGKATLKLDHYQEWQGVDSSDQSFTLSAS